MPPKAKYTRDEVAQKALDIIKEQGIDKLTARELGKRLETSSRPVFTAFQNMEEVKMAARELAMKEFIEYVGDYKEYTPAFKRIGMMLVSYGIYYPELFKLLFIKENANKNFKELMGDISDIFDTCTALIMRDYKITKEEAVIVFEHCCTTAFGLGTMCAMGVCSFTDEEIGRKLGLSFMGALMVIKSGRLSRIYPDVEKSDNGKYHGIPLYDI